MIKKLNYGDIKTNACHGESNTMHFETGQQLSKNERWQTLTQLFYYNNSAQICSNVRWTLYKLRSRPCEVEMLKELMHRWVLFQLCFTWKVIYHCQSEICKRYSYKNERKRQEAFSSKNEDLLFYQVNRWHSLRQVKVHQANSSISNRPQMSVVSKNRYEFSIM